MCINVYKPSISVHSRYIPPQTRREERKDKGMEMATEKFNTVLSFSLFLCYFFFASDLECITFRSGLGERVSSEVGVIEKEQNKPSTGDGEGIGRDRRNRQKPHSYGIQKRIKRKRYDKKKRKNTRTCIYRYIHIYRDGGREIRSMALRRSDGIGALG